MDHVMSTVHQYPPPPPSPLSAPSLPSISSLPLLPFLSFPLILPLVPLFPPSHLQVLVVIAVVFLVLLYRLAVAGLIYRLVSGIAGGPSVGDIIVSITGACIQLVAILILNIIYTKFANILTGWGED